MGKADEKEDLSVAARDFSPRWHLVALGVIGLVVLAAYFVASKLVLS
jgi:hypothetical protein